MKDKIAMKFFKKITDIITNLNPEKVKKITWHDLYNFFEYF